MPALAVVTLRVPRATPGHGATPAFVHHDHPVDAVASLTHPPERQELLDRAIEALDSYMTKDTDNSVFDEPAV